MQALILAGGRGIRLKPLTDDAPVSLLYLPGGSILDYLLHHLTYLPVDAIGLVLQYHGDHIARYLGEQPGLRLIPQQPPFTLLSALASAASWVQEPTLVLHGDHYFSHDFRYLLHEADPTRPTFLLPDPADDPSQVSQAGAYLLPPDAFKVATEIKGESSVAALYHALHKRGLRPALLPLQGWMRHIDTPADLLTVNRYLLTRWHEAMHPPAASRGYDALNFNWIAPDAEVDAHFRGLFVTIGPGACVQRSHLHNILMLPGVVLKDANEQDAVLAANGSLLHHFYSTRPASAWSSF